MFTSHLRTEAPEFKRCCFCLPLRRGLIAWGYTKAGLNILMILYLGTSFYWYALNRSRSKAQVEAYDIAIFSIIIVCLISDIIFNIIFIAAGHMKSVKLLKVSYVYNMVWFGLLTLACCFPLYMTISHVYRMWSYIEFREYFVFNLLLSSGLAASIILVQMYIILLIRSEMAKLQNQMLEMQFSNHAASDEPHCTLHNALGTAQCTDKKLNAQD